jgi:hypothetical protein
MIAGRSLAANASRAAAVLLAAGSAGTAFAADADRFWELDPRVREPPRDPDFSLFPRHPRLVFRPSSDPGTGRTFEEVRRLFACDATFRGIFDKAELIPVEKRHPAVWAALWIVTGNDEYAQRCVAMMADGVLSQSGEPDYSNVWSYALAFDWLYGHPAFEARSRDLIAGKIIERLRTELDGLDGDEMALWHGRNQAANGAMTAALAVGDIPAGEPLLRRAVLHYVESLRALEYSEGWPEGASYWIYNRAGPYALAADCVMTAMGTDTLAGISIRDVCRRIGYWQVYSFAPNGMFEPYGDSAGSLRLGETGWWELTTDHYARLSRDPGLMAGADYIRNRSPSPYGERPYQWNVVMTYDPSVRPADGYDPGAPELWMESHLPQAMLFGRDSMGVAFFRGKWGDTDELYSTFKAGDLLAHHDHYDTGHFGIQRGGLLAPQTGAYGPGGYDGEYRLGYAVQTVSANSLLVLAPGETSGYLRSRNKGSGWAALSGGQRVIRPTSFNCISMDHYMDQRDNGPHLERATITAFRSEPGVFDYIAADITGAYNSTRWSEPGSIAKVSLVTRQFLYLRQQDVFVIYDRVETADPAFLPKFLVHHTVKPETASEKLLVGNGPDNGILETRDREICTVSGRGRLLHRVLLPSGMRALKIGGSDFSAYVEDSGCQDNGFKGRDLRPQSLRPGGGARPGLWRTEVEPEGRGTSTRFLNVLYALSAADLRQPPPERLIEAGEDARAVLVGDVVCVFGLNPGPLRKVRLVFPASGKTCLVLDALPGADYSCSGRKQTADGDGVLVMPCSPGEIEIAAEGGNLKPET